MQKNHVKMIKGAIFFTILREIMFHLPSFRLYVSAVLVVFVANCKRTHIPSPIIEGERYARVGDNVAITMYYPDKSTCKVVVADVARKCEKLEQKKFAFYSQLGTLSKGRTHKIELQIDRESKTLYYRYRKAKSRNSFHLRLDIPSKTAELLRTQTPLKSSSSVANCKITKRENISIYKAVPLSLQRMATLGFAVASASSHPRNENFARIRYKEFNDEQWDFFYVESEYPTRFILPKPAIIESAEFAGISLTNSLRADEEKHSNLQQGDTPQAHWEITDHYPNMELTLTITSDDRETIGRCYLKPEQETMTLNKEFWNKLKQGKYTVRMQLRSFQRVEVQGGDTALWKIDAYDWRYGFFNKS